MRNYFIGLSGIVLAIFALTGIGYLIFALAGYLFTRPEDGVIFLMITSMIAVPCYLLREPISEFGADILKRIKK